ncbi:MAG: hypothetical protein ACLGIS_03760 [Actinomycetes bacterium]|jgi:hypothetical protein
MARKHRQGNTEAPIRQVTPAPHWKKLRQGDRVTVHFAPGFAAGGLVDAVTSDHTAVWIDFDGGRGRTLLHCSDGIDIVRDSGDVPQEEAVSQGGAVPHAG